MDNGKDNVTRTRRLVQWLKDKIEKRRDSREDHDPWWVTLMLDVGRPVVAILILTMCAPGEHYLARQAGWSERLAWGMPGTLTAYAGIAAVVATKRPRGAPGRKTAVWGAVLSILVAMAAQPIAHLYGRTGLNPQEIVLTVAVSCIPAAVFGHLLHMGAATPKSVRVSVSEPDKRSDKMSAVLAGADSGVLDIPHWMADNGIPSVSTGGQSVTLSEPEVSVPDTSPDEATWTPSDMSETEVSEPVDTTSGVRSMSGSLAADVRNFLDRFPDATDTELFEAMAELHPDKKSNSIYKARVRYEEKIGKGRTA